MKTRIMRHFISVYTVCTGNNSSDKRKQYVLEIIAVGLGRYKLHANHTSNSDFDRTVMPCLGYYFFPAEPEWGTKNVDWFFEILVETISLEIDKCMS